MILVSTPTCGPAVPRSSVTENEVVDFTCRMTYRWTSVSRMSNLIPNIHEHFGWEDDSRTPASRMLSLSTASEQTVVQNMTVSAAKKPEIPAQNCTLSFTFTPPQRLTARYSFAVNSVSYTCNSAPIPVRGKFSMKAYIMSLL